MKKIISIIVIVLGVILAAAGIIIAAMAVQHSKSSSIGIIGGADGPTAVFVTGTIGGSGILAIGGILLVGIALLVIGIYSISHDFYGGLRRK